MNHLHNLTALSLQVRAIPHEERPRCSTHCRYVLVELSDVRHSWRCTECLNYSTDVLEQRVRETDNQPSLF